MLGERSPRASFIRNARLLRLCLLLLLAALCSLPVHAQWHNVENIYWTEAFMCRGRSAGRCTLFEDAFYANSGEQVVIHFNPNSASWWDRWDVNVTVHGSGARFEQRRHNNGSRERIFFFQISQSREFFFSIDLVNAAGLPGGEYEVRVEINSRYPDRGSPRPRPTPTVHALSPNLRVGGRAIHVDGTATNVRRGPGLSNGVVEALRGNEIVDVLEGPRRANGYQWYRIRKSNGVSGWVAESGGGSYWLRPCTASRCPSAGDGGGDSLSSGGGRIAYGQRKTGTLNDRNYFDDWKFNASAGDVITITMDKTSGSIDPLLRLYNSSGSELAENDDGGSGNNARISNYRISRAGEYTIHTLRYATGASGGYRLTLSGSRATSTPRPRTISYGQSVDGSLSSSNNNYDEYRFDARAGDVVTISMRRRSGDLRPYIRLYGSASERITEESDSLENNERINVFRIPRAGRYTIRAWSVGTSEGGNYRLQLSRAEPTRTPAPTSTPEPRNIAFGQSVSGALSSSSTADQYTFDAREGYFVTITMARASGNLDPKLRLYTSAGRALAESAGSGEYARISDFRIPASGSFRIRAGRTSGAGDYRLSLFGAKPTPLPSPTSPPSPTPTPDTPQTRPISYGDHKSGTLAGASMYHLYEFTGAAGDDVRIEMRRYPGANIAPSVSLWNDSGVKLAEDRNSSTARDAIIGSYIIPSDGRYTISANNGHDGDGRYEVSLIRWVEDGDPVNLDAPGSLAGIEFTRYTNSYRFPDQQLVEEGSFQEAIRITVDDTRGSLDKGLKVCLPEPADGSTRNGIMMFLDESAAPPKLKPLYSWFEQGSVCMGIRKPGTIVSMPANHQGAATLWSDTAKGIVVSSGLGEIVRRSSGIIVDGLLDKASGKLADKAQGFAGSLMSKYSSKLPLHVANRLGKEVLGESGEALAKSAHKEVLTSQGLHRNAFRQAKDLLLQQRDEIFAAKYQAIVGQYVAEMGEEAGQRTANLVALESTDDFITSYARSWADGALEESAEQLTRETIEAAGRQEAERGAKKAVIAGSAKHIAKEFLASDEGLEVTNSLGSLIQDSASEVLGDFGGEAAAFVTDIVTEVVAGKFTALFKSGVFAVDAARGIFADLGLNQKLRNCMLTVKEMTPIRQTPKGFIISYLPPSAELDAIARTPNWFKVRLNEGWLENAEWVSAEAVWESGNCG